MGAPRADGASEVDAYLAAQPRAMREALERIRSTIRAAAPGAIEVISYRVPAFRTEAGLLVHYAGFSRHGSLFPGSLRRFPELEREMAPFATATGTLQFTVDHPLPTRLITRLVKARLAGQRAR